MWPYELNNLHTKLFVAGLKKNLLQNILVLSQFVFKYFCFLKL